MPGLFAIGDPIPATAPMHGLVSAATEVKGSTRQTSDGRTVFDWEAGVTICPENCTTVSTWDPDCAAWINEDDEFVLALKEKSVATANPGCYDLMPFVLESPFQCDASGFKVIDFAGRARRQCDVGTSKGMEFELWTGTQKPANPHLDDGAIVLGAGAPFDVLEGYAMLSQALSNCAHGGRGTIHATTHVVDELLGKYSGLFNVDAARIVSKNRGDVLISGTGYPGTGPAGVAVADDQFWMFATGPVTYRLSEILVFPDTIDEAIDRKNNDVEYRAERFAVVNFDPCCHFGVLVTTAATAED